MIKILNSLQQVTHELKCDPKPFILMWNGFKKFEIRKNDRDFKQYDFVKLRETLYSAKEMANGKPLEYTFREIIFKIIQVHTDLLEYGIPEGYCILSFEG